MYTALIGIAVFAVVALAGWGVAELKGKACNYEASEDEEKSLENWTDNLNKREREMDIDDVKATISTKGFSAV